MCQLCPLALICQHHQRCHIIQTSTYLLKESCFLSYMRSKLYKALCKAWAFSDMTHLLGEMCRSMGKQVQTCFKAQHLTGHAEVCKHFVTDTQHLQEMVQYMPDMGGHISQEGHQRRSQSYSSYTLSSSNSQLVCFGDRPLVR